MGVGEKILKIFESAPPWWIVGIQANDSIASCRRSLVFSLCINSCPSTDEIEKTTKPVFKIQIAARSERGTFEYYTTNERSGIQFSPDNKKILVDGPLIYPDSNIAHTRPIIIDMNSKEVQLVPYDNVNGAWWLTNDKLLFRYEHKVLPYMLAHHELSTGLTETKSDSVTYFHCLSPDKRKLVFLTVSRNKNYTTIWLQDLQSCHTIKLLESFANSVQPYAWSPDGVSILVSEQAEEFRKTLILHTETKQIQPLPLLNSDFAGWSPDGSSIYMARYKRGDYNFKGELWSYSVASQQLNALIEPRKGLHYVTYNPVIDQFLLAISDDLYLMDSKGQSSPRKFLNNCYFGAWRSDGTGIVYQGPKDRHLWYWSSSDSSKSQLTFGEVPKKKMNKKLRP